MLSIFRIVAGILFITFGTMKVFGHPPGPPGMPPFDPMTQTGPGTGTESTPSADELVLDQTFTADNLFALRNAVAAHGAEAGLSDQRLSDLVLLAHELASNAIRHGGADTRAPGRLRLWRAVEADGRTAVVCEISDSGPGLAGGTRNI